MGYTVGSASVDIVPDFKNAQLAITAFFNKQRDELKIPAKLDLDNSSFTNAEKQAAAAGSRVSKALNQSAARQQAVADKAAVQAAKTRERAITFAHGEALKMQAQMDREAERLAKAALSEEAKARIQAERDIERTAKESERALQQAHADALRMNTAIDRERTKSLQQAHAEALRMNAVIDRDNARRAREELRREQSAARLAIQTAQRVARERQRIADEESRQRNQSFREQERAFQQQLREEIRALKVAQRAAAKDEKIRLQVEIDDRKALLAGRRAGGLVTRAMHEELRQNAGIISAVIGGILLAGAPAAIGAATALFGGIGAVAAFQNDRLRRTWTGLWDEIKQGATADAAVLVPAFNRMAGSIGQAFQRMRPQIRDAFGASVPLVDSFSASVTKATENALPGLVRAVIESGPVVHGLGDLLKNTGSGLSDFFDTLATHAPAAGQAASDLGDTIRVLLPTIAELLGQGAELATLVLPVLTSGFGGLNAVIHLLGGNLPLIASAFLGFRAAQGAGRLVTGFAQSLDRTAQRGGAFSKSLGKTASVLGALGKAAPIVGIALAGFAEQEAQVARQTDQMTQLLLRGGAEAKRFREFMATDPRAKDKLGDQYRQAQKDVDAYLKSLTPLERAQHDVDVASRDLADALGDENTTSSELAAKKAAVSRAAAKQRAEEEKLQRATEGVTQAMQDQANAARARVDAAFGYQQSVLDVTKAQEKYQEVLKDEKSTANDVAEALLDVNQAYADQVAAAGAVATANLPAALTDQQKAAIGAKAELDELNKLIAQGVVLPPSLESYRQQLIGITNDADGATLEQAQFIAALGEVGVAAEAIPGTKTIKIDAPTDEVRAKLDALGFTVVELPDGSISVQAVTDAAKKNLANLSTQLAGVDGTTAKPKVDLKPEPYEKKSSRVRTSLASLDGSVAAPMVSVRDHATGVITSIASNLAALRDKWITVTTENLVVNRSTKGGAFAATGGAVEDVLAGRNLPRFDRGGATFGIGGPLDDLNTIRVSPGEHVLDTKDVALMGGQAGVYAFRDMLNSGKLGTPGTAVSNGVRQMVAAAGPRTPYSPGSSTPPRAVALYTPDIPAAIRALRAVEHQEAVLAPVWP